MDDKLENNMRKGKPFYGIILIIFLILAILLGAYFGLAWLLRKLDKNISQSTNQTTESTLESGIKDDQIIGTWISECLVPDLNSPWAEKHQMVIEKNKITHTRWENSSGSQDCDNPTDTKVTNYSYAIPSVEKINLVSNDGTIYDIYHNEGNMLYFGHGFRGDNMSYPTEFGGSEDDRINTLNKYISYSKN